ncbi:TetR/AcrR family transcriptional regulator [Streptomyces sp. SCA3-4]|uniref:TetR/AcrR family transcriptional regulator n=1 Tax=Streptomyces sichuanensis TaxID=2871810 RepID=UPI001CE32EB2|nr:TetR/AcrR family transcriptional regulator [Streptomyces sichuanensis]MCA6091923.1 TetR/AcrR family transcriptional regulator [Streptomyces sichuanensis]
MSASTGRTAAGTGRQIRRYGAELQAAIFEAVVGQLYEHGYQGVTMEGVAAAAQTGKAVLYRRWAGKDDLVLDALRHFAGDPGKAPDTGSVRDDLVDLLQRMAASTTTPTGSAVRMLLAGTRQDPGFVRMVREKVLRPRTELLAEVLDRAVARGQARPGASSPLVARTGPALVLHHLASEDAVISREEIERIVDEVLMPLISPR